MSDPTHSRGTLPFLALIVAAACLCRPHVDAAPDPDAAPDGPETVGLVDMTVVFENWDRFRAERDRITAEARREADKFRPLYNDLLAMREQLEELPKESENYNWVKRDYEDRYEKYGERREAHKRKFSGESPQLYRELYDEVRVLLSDIAEERGLELVIRFRRDPEEPGTPEDVLKDMNRLVLFHRGADLTDEIIALLNAG